MMPYLVIGGFVLLAIVIGTLVGQALWLRSLDKIINESFAATGADIAALDGRLAHLNRVVSRKTQAERDEDAVVIEWRECMEKLPKGSPKRIAFENRLRELGAL